MQFTPNGEWFGGEIYNRGKRDRDICEKCIWIRRYGIVFYVFIMCNITRGNGGTSVGKIMKWFGGIGERIKMILKEDDLDREIWETFYGRCMIQLIFWNIPRIFKRCMHEATLARYWSGLRCIYSSIS